MMIQLTPRRKAILKVNEDEFTITAEPVGSRRVMDLLDFSCSSATIRNDMAALEELGLLEKTHTSSGRIPSAKGYRYYVEHLMERQLDDEVKHSLQQVFTDRRYSMDEIVKKSCDILSQMTSLTSIVLGPESRYQTLQHIQLFPLTRKSAVAIFITDHGHTENKTFHFDTDISVEDIKTCCNVLNEQLAGTAICDIVEKMHYIQPLLASKVARHEILFEAFVTAFMKFAKENVYCSGKNNMLYQPEFSDITQLRELMRMLEDSSLFRQISSYEGNMRIEIGGENQLIQMNNVAVVSSRFKLGNHEEGKLMVVGPSRMQYNRVVALMEYMSEVLEDMYKE